MKAIIFDFDGVILDSVDVKTQAFGDLYAPFGAEIKKKVIAHHLLHGGVSRFEKFKIYHNEFLHINISEKQIDDLAKEFSGLVFEKVLAACFIDGAESFLNYVHAKYKTFVCTGTPQNEIEQIVDKRCLNNYFDELHGSPRKKTEIISKLLIKHNLAPSEVLFLGDAMTDYDAAKDTRINFVGIKNEDTDFPKGTILVSDLMEIIELKHL